MDDLVAFLRARLDEEKAALVRCRDGHDGPCLNFEGQAPENYDEYDSCYRHIETFRATRYSNVEFGLADIKSKRRIIDDFAPMAMDGHGTEQALSEWTLRCLALPFADHPDYREEWKP